MATQILCLVLNWVVCLNYQVVNVISSRYKFAKTSRGLSPLHPPPLFFVMPVLRRALAGTLP